MDDNDITFIVGWPTEPEMVKFRKVAAAAIAAERERCAKLCEDHAGMRGTGAWVAMTAAADRIRDA